MKVSELLANILIGDLFFTEDDKGYLDSYFHPVEIKKEQFLIREGEIERYSYFIERGILRCWTYDSEAEEKTFWFSFPNEFSFSNISLNLQAPSEFNVQAITDCSLWRISHADIYRLYSDSRRINHIMDVLTAHVFMNIVKRNLNLIKLKPHEYYNYLLREQKDYLKYIPLKYIASYLGITPQALSRIRRRIT